LLSYFKDFGCKFSLKTTCEIGIQLIEALQILHKAGYVHNDLKLDNILVGDRDSSFKSLSEIKLIDLGFNTRYVTRKGEHITEELKYSKGNIAFASKNVLNGIVPSRRDDLISLTYMLLYMLTGSFEFLNINIQVDKYEKICYQKYIATVKTLSRKLCKPFNEFIKEVFVMQFSEDPNYDSLKSKLQKIITDKGLECDRVFDWNK
jgi:serine/threonine protein kinase